MSALAALRASRPAPTAIPARRQRTANPQGRVIGRQIWAKVPDAGTHRPAMTPIHHTACRQFTTPRAARALRVTRYTCRLRGPTLGLPEMERAWPGYGEAACDGWSPGWR